MMSREEALAYATNFKKFTRCWRVENSRAGTSRLVTKAAAAALRSMYGGDIVRLVDAMPHTMTKAEWRAIGMDRCSFCAAEPDEPCLTRAGRVTMPHAQRSKIDV
jgi:hypothetical protein